MRFASRMAAPPSTTRADEDEAPPPAGMFDSITKSKPLTISCTELSASEGHRSLDVVLPVRLWSTVFKKER